MTIPTINCRLEHVTRGEDRRETEELVVVDAVVIPNLLVPTLKAAVLAHRQRLMDESDDERHRKPTRFYVLKAIQAEIDATAAIIATLKDQTA